MLLLLPHIVGLDRGTCEKRSSHTEHTISILTQSMREINWLFIEEGLFHCGPDNQPAGNPIKAFTKQRPYYN